MNTIVTILVCVSACGVLMATVFVAKTMDRIQDNLHSSEIELLKKQIAFVESAKNELKRQLEVEKMWNTELLMKNHKLTNKLKKRKGEEVRNETGQPII